MVRQQLQAAVEAVARSGAATADPGLVVALLELLEVLEAEPPAEPQGQGAGDLARLLDRHLPEGWERPPEDWLVDVGVLCWWDGGQLHDRGVAQLLVELADPSV